MKLNEIDKLFKDKIEGLDSMPPDINWDMEETFNKIDSRLNNKTWKPRFLDLAASMILIVVSGWFVTHKLNETSESVIDNKVSEKIEIQVEKDNIKFDLTNQVKIKSIDQVNSLEKIDLVAKKEKIETKLSDALLKEVIAFDNSIIQSGSIASPNKISGLSLVDIKTENIPHFANLKNEISKKEITSFKSVKKNSKRLLSFTLPFFKGKKNRNNNVDDFSTPQNQFAVNLPVGLGMNRSNIGATLSAGISYKKNKDAVSYKTYSLALSTYAFYMPNQIDSQEFNTNTFVEASLGKKRNGSNSALINNVGLGYQIQGNIYGRRAIKLNLTKSFKSNKIHFSPEFMITNDLKSVAPGFKLTIGDV